MRLDQTIREVEEWLDQEYMTEIAAVDRMPGTPELVVHYARGLTEGETGSMVTRPMFQVLADRGDYLPVACSPCPRCDDWAYTTACPDHPDLSLEAHCAAQAAILEEVSEDVWS